MVVDAAVLMTQRERGPVAYRPVSFAKSATSTFSERPDLKNKVGGLEKVVQC